MKLRIWWAVFWTIMAFLIIEAVYGIVRVLMIS